MKSHASASNGVCTVYTTKKAVYEMRKTTFKFNVSSFEI